MNDQGRENLDELIERFYNGDQAGDALEDVRRGEQLLRNNPAPEPDPEERRSEKDPIGFALIANKPQAASPPPLHGCCRLKGPDDPVSG